VEWIEKCNKSGESGLHINKRSRLKRPVPEAPEEKMQQLEMENEILRAFQKEYERWDAKHLDSKCSKDSEIDIWYRICVNCWTYSKRLLQMDENKG